MHPKTLRRYFDRFAGATGEVQIVQERTVLILDAFYFRRGEGVLVCRTTEKVLHWRWIATERIGEYACCLNALGDLGRSVAAATIDGRKGVRQLLESRGILVQFCQFHQILTVKGYIPARAKTEAARALRSVAVRLTSMHSLQFITALGVWHILYGAFLAERTYGTANKRRWQYTHRRLRSAYASLRRNTPYLFTFEQYPALGIPNTTNHCDGLFAHIKERIGIHRGLNSDRRKQMTDYLLESWSV